MTRPKPKPPGAAADGRILAGNALYTELMALCGIGKALYATTHARKYEDYVVTDAPPRRPRPSREGSRGSYEKGHQLGRPFFFC